MGSTTTARRPRTTPAPRLFRRLSALLPLGLATALGLSLAAPLTPQASPTATPPVRLAAAAPASSTYTTFTLNVQFSLSQAKALADMRRALTLGDAGGFQELSQKVDRDSLVALCTEEDWGYYMPGDGGVADPIVWNRDRFRLIDARSVRVHGPLGKNSPSRYINIVRLREIATGKVFGMINTHTLSGASRDAQATNPDLLPYLRKHLQMLRTEILGLFDTTEFVFASGDLNVNYLADRRRQVAGLPTRALGDVVSFDMPLVGSHGTRSLLDYGMSVKHDGGLVLDTSRVVRGFNSDHDLVQLTYSSADLFAAGPLFNAPGGDAHDQSRVLTRQARAVRDTEPGALVRLATTRLDDPSLADALLAAAARGVDVQVVLGAGAPSVDEQRLEDALGTDQTTGSWLFRCTGTCATGKGRMLANFLLVSRAGGTTDLTLVASSPSVLDGAKRFTDVYRSATSSVYDGYGAVFSALALGEAPPRAGSTVSFGSHRAQLYPATAGPGQDPVLRALAPVRCTGAQGIRTSDGRTNVRVAALTWGDARGLEIAARLARLKRAGCDVVAVLGPAVQKPVSQALLAAKVPTRRAAVGQNLIVVDGRYGRSTAAEEVWTGGPGWNQAGLDSSAVTLQVLDASVTQAYLDAFTRAWQSA